MAYQRQNFQDGEVLTADKLNHMEDGIVNASDSQIFVSNPNLLDNWYFGNPVNQRGKTEHSGSGYFLDRWISAGGKFKIDANGLTLGVDKVSSWLNERLDIDFTDKTVTVSCLTSDGKLYSKSGVAKKVNNTIAYWFADGGNVALSFDTSISKYKFALGRFDTTGEMTIIAAKLELGSSQTLAHKENGQWVLNEIPNYAEELAKCRRYCRVYPSGSYLPCLAFGKGGGWYASAALPFDMCKNPTNDLGNLGAVLADLDSGGEIVCSISNWGTMNGLQKLRLSSGAKDFTENNTYTIRLSNDLILSADL